MKKIILLLFLAGIISFVDFPVFAGNCCSKRKCDCKVQQCCEKGRCDCAGECCKANECECKNGCNCKNNS